MIAKCFTFHSGDGGHGDGRGGGDGGDDNEVRLICGRDGDGGGRGGCCDGRRRSQWHRRCPQPRPLR